MRHFFHFLTKAYETKFTLTNKFALFILRESDPNLFNRGSQPAVDFSEWLAVQKFQIILAMAGPTKASGEGRVNYERNWPLGRAEV
jgi:hypothetical protein